MRSIWGWWILASTLVLLDWYVFSAVKSITQNYTERTRLVVHTAYWCITVLAVATILLFPYVQVLQTNKFFRNYVFAILAGLFFAKLITATVLVVDDVRRLGTWAAVKVGNNLRNQPSPWEGVAITRSVFMSWLGVALGSLLFGSLVAGFRNKYNYQVRRVKIPFPNLPDAFDGFVLAHISDVHSGSFQNKEAVLKGIQKINAAKPDVILFTGDLVNDRAEEMHPYKDVFAQLAAPHGVFSVLGNHDYGDYVQWKTPEAKTANLNELKNIQAAMGWRLLMNEHVALEKDGQKIALLGIENWGAKGRFPKYGKLSQAHTDTEKFDFKILMSHDPSHWDAEVKPQYTDIDLMLSGHTHGMQFGLQNPYFKWSPVQWMYKQWSGLYVEGKQHLYVNPGFGFIGYPGRVGILPEITLIELKKA